MSDSRKFSTDYSVHQSLIAMFARKGLARLKSMNVSVDFDDVFQGMSLTYTKSLKTYSAEKGVGFTAYMGRAIWNEFNRFAEKAISEQTHLDLVSANISDELSFMEFIPSDELTPEERLDRKQQNAESVRRLSQQGRKVVKELISPSQQLQGKLKIAQESGHRNVSEMTVRFIALNSNMSLKTLELVRKELFNVYGAKV